MTEPVAALIDVDKRVGTITRVNASAVELTIPQALAASGQRGLAKGTAGDFIFIDCDQECILGRIVDVAVPERQRPNLERQLEHDAVAEPQGRAQLLATISKSTHKVVRGINIKPRVGDSVYLADGDALASAIREALQGELIDGREERLLVNLGRLSGIANATISMPPEKLFGRHCGIFGATGGGKSWTLSKLLNEVVRLRGKCILFDPTGEFSGKVSGATEFSFSKERPGQPLARFPYRRLSEIDLYALLTPSAQMQGPNLRSAIKSLRLAKLLGSNPDRFPSAQLDDGSRQFEFGGRGGYVDVRQKGVVRKKERSRNAHSVALIELASDLDSHMCDFDIRLLSDQIKEECVKQHNNQKKGAFGDVDEFALSSCNSLMVRIENYLSSPEMGCLFADHGVDICSEILAFLEDDERHAMVLSFADVSFKYNTRELLLNTLGRFLLGLARDNMFMKRPLVAFLDEAHQFIGRSIGDEANNVSLDAFGLIAKEGRKYGLTAAIATQRPRDVPNDVLSQLGTLFVHRLTNERDRETIERACGDLDRDAAAFIPSLAQGEAIVVGPELPAPLPIIINRPEKGQQPESHGPRYQQYWGAKRKNIVAARS
ncbi:ATP-binding protein [Rhizobium leguminosarum bv. trifolii]|uniref:ATP-binding protein n=1 Tax=Rhizobium leguminosarum TaxID=384 RepID=UPI00140FB09C|nr:ATP-binding protein [Rhizobium leguminosarum]QIO70611.1 ATP-binding protein [Rhizobium leguminosarum bv. trifolii]QIO77616.1 ATP-binding protein [Rhizobium leguminosarum bv. trifolii]